MILKYKHKFSDSALDDILNLVRIIIPSPNILPKSTKTLSKYLDIKTHVKSHFICHDCSTVNDIASTNCI